MIQDNATDTGAVPATIVLTSKERRDRTENERITTWRERHATMQPSFSYKSGPMPESISESTTAIEQSDSVTTATESPTQSPKDICTYIHPYFPDPNMTPLQKAEAQRAALCAATGTASEEYGRMILSQTMSGFFHNSYDDDTRIANAVHEALLAMKPADEYEGMLCNRLLVLHDHYMRYMSICATPDKPQQVIDMYINRATKLMRMYNETLDVLNRHRRKGEQKVTVQHVNVNNGGQAVVTGELTRGGVNDKK
jgi:hypothetical protein